MTSSAQRIDVQTDDGTAPCWVHAPAGTGKLPGVLMFPDAGSVRAAVHDVAQHLASQGFVVLVPDIFYRAGAYAPFDFRTVFSVPSERERLFGLIHSLDPASAMRDAAHYLRALREQPGTAPGKLGVTGYCMGGRLAFLTAATRASDIGAMAGFHAGGLVSDAPDSPHLLASTIQASVYLGVADNDTSCSPEHQGALATALGQAHVDYAIELYRGAAHGFAMPDAPVFDAAASQRHMERMVGLFRRTLTAV